MRNRHNNTKYADGSLAAYLMGFVMSFERHYKRIYTEIYETESGGMSMVSIPFIDETDVEELNSDAAELLSFVQSMKLTKDHYDDTTYSFLEALKKRVTVSDLKALIDAVSARGSLYRLINYSIGICEKHAREQEKIESISGECKRCLQIIKTIVDNLRQSLEKMETAGLADAIKYDDVSGKNRDIDSEMSTSSTIFAAGNQVSNAGKITEPEEIKNKVSKAEIGEGYKTLESQKNDEVSIIKAGLKLLTNREKLYAYLRGSIKDELRCRLLMDAYDIGFLPKVYKELDKEKVAKGFSDLLVEKYGITRDNANWSINTWCKVFNYNIDLERVQDKCMDNVMSDVENNNKKTEDEVELGVGIYKCGIDVEPGELALTVTWKKGGAFDGREYLCYKVSSVPNRFEDEECQFRDKCYVRIQKGQYLQIEGPNWCKPNILSIKAKKVGD